MTEIQNSKQYDLEDRTFKFVQDVPEFIKDIPNSIANQEDIRQRVKSSGSIGANHIEANEALSKKDFIMRIKICRKEAKESVYWLRLLDIQGNSSLDRQKTDLIQESSELTHIFGAIITKSR